ncbi:phosphatase [Vibrio campbellii]|uniref:phosphatase n=1 Tax=Vibrio campbellii TaxID=680 RepID=UPI00040D770A|nr:phosphatase [Vibrio campbellii]
MELKVDTHTHTYASGHAYSTLIENAKSAKENGLDMFCTTDHAESMPGRSLLVSLTKKYASFLEGVAIIRGVESNIMNTQGDIDIPESVDRNLDWVIASFHEPVFRPADSATHTEALLNIIKNGRVDALGHLGNPNFDFDFEVVLKCAKEHYVAIEINNTTLKGNSRVGSVDRCHQIAQIGKDLGVFFTTGSDAHFCHDVGNLSLVSELMDRVGIDSSKVITHSAQQFLAFLELRGRKPIAEYDEIRNA